MTYETNVTRDLPVLFWCFNVPAMVLSVLLIAWCIFEAWRGAKHAYARNEVRKGNPILAVCKGCFSTR